MSEVQPQIVFADRAEKQLEETLRLRSGDYRAVFEKMPDGRLKVLRVAHRREIYR